MRFLQAVSRALFDTFRFLAGPNPQPQVHHKQKPVTYTHDEKVRAKLKEFDDLRAEREGGWGETQFLQR